MARLDFYFDFSSPFAYLGATQVEALAKRTGADLHLCPLLLGGLFREVGQVDVPIFAMPERKRQYSMLDLQRWADWWGVPLSWPASFPMRTVLPLRLFLLEPSPQRMRKLFHAAWGEGRDIGNEAVLRELGFSEAELQAAPGQKAALLASHQRAVDAGVFGVPTFVVNGTTLFWGQDRIDQVERALLA